MPFSSCISNCNCMKFWGNSSLVKTGDGCKELSTFTVWLLKTLFNQALEIACLNFLERQDSGMISLTLDIL